MRAPDGERAQDPSAEVPENPQPHRAAGKPPAAEDRAQPLLPRE